ncbi:Coiled-coil domain-containing protein 14 [Bagarius yarrelli]|uniref:Coiled-coil domain-containing protein 14 n=1 Tax=Bagarius yarrelli TaxID=175774 RepID=A0A556TTJ7_BAGYA|nr:Coiled-coil domain-containing protein 14 [Bagarius yarrelli]
MTSTKYSNLYCRVTGRPPHPEPSYSLYSTDSEDQVTTINKGLDRCAALLSDLLQAEETDPKRKSRISTVSPFKNKSSVGKNETVRKKIGKKANTIARVTKRPAVVQKTILPSRAYTGFKRQPRVHGVQQPPADVIGLDSNPGGTSVTQVECVQPRSFPQGSGLPFTEPQPSTVFNCRLTTSTPALSPHRPPSAHSQASVRGADGETRHFAQQFSAAAPATSTRRGASSATISPTQYTAPFTVAPAVQLQPTVSTPGQFKPVENAPQVCSGVQSSALQSHSGPQIRSSPPASTRLPTSAPLPQHILPCDQDQQLSSGECVLSSSEESGDCMSEEDRVDTMPVRDTNCQTSVDMRPGILKNKRISGSPEKTARKVLTVKYLLGELKMLVANQDSEAVRLISEVEQSISLLPAMVGSTNIQAELALALQPLRSENVQLRRRLRILNQQLQERERAERQARSVDCNLEVVSLQSLNLNLQTQIKERDKQLDNLQITFSKRISRNSVRLWRAEKTTCNRRKSSTNVSEALTEMRNCQSKLEDCEMEKTELTHSLQQRETEITKLQDIIRNLQKNPILCHPSQTDVSRGSAPAAQLTKSVLDQYENQQRESTLASRITDSVKTYLQTLEDSGHSSPPHPAPPQSGQWKRRQENTPESLDLHTPLKNAKVRGVSQDVEQNETTFVSLPETAGLPPAAVPQKHSADNNHAGMKYLGLAFNKLAISNGLPSLTDVPGTEFLRPDAVSLQPSEAADQSQHARRRLHMGNSLVYTGRPSAYENSFLSCDVKSLASDCSVNSWSTFNTRDEQQFRNGLAALDASIASLQRTLKADLKR